MRALIDGDILRYEVGFASEAGWKSGDNEGDVPPFDYVQDLLNERIANIMAVTKADEYTIYLTEGSVFREELATKKPYKGQRIEHKPWHYNNLSAVLKDVYNTEVVTHIEADDAMSVAQCKSNDTIVCSRDKDLRQVPGWVYSWELGNQPQFGPEYVDRIGYLKYDTERNKLTGTGFAFFAAQVLMGDTSDNIPGLPKVGPLRAYNILKEAVDSGCTDAINDELETAYRLFYHNDYEEELLEQGRLLWMTRALTLDGLPELWELGMDA